MTTEVNVLLNKKRYFYNRYSEEIVSDDLIIYIMNLLEAILKIKLK